MIFNVENGLKRLVKDPTPKYQKEVKDINKNCTTIVDKSTWYKHVQIKLEAPQLDVLIKLQKEN
jgi:hypothetical protein